MCIGILRFGALASVALLASQPVQAGALAEPERVERVAIDVHVQEAARRFGLPVHWLYAVIRAESAGRVRAVSPAGAMGLMQLMPGTWARQRARLGLGSDPFDPRDNILAGTAYLREMYDRFGTPGFLAAYNAGPGRYEAWLAGRRRLPRETQRYVARLAPKLQADRLFIAAEAVASSLPAAPDPPAPDTADMRSARTESATSAYPPARPVQPAHDLFAAISTTIEP